MEQSPVASLASKAEFHTPRIASSAGDLVDLETIEAFLREARISLERLFSSLARLRSEKADARSAVGEELRLVRMLQRDDEKRQANGVAESEFLCAAAPADLLAEVKEQTALTRLHVETFARLAANTPPASPAAVCEFAKLEALRSRHCAVAARISELGTRQTEFSRRLRENWKRLCLRQRAALCGLLRVKASLHALHSRALFLRAEADRQTEALGRLETLRRLPGALAEASREVARRVLFEGLFRLAVETSRQAISRLHIEETQRRTNFLAHIAPWLPRNEFSALLEAPPPLPSIPATETARREGSLLEELIDSEALSSLLKSQLEEWEASDWQSPDAQRHSPLSSSNAALADAAAKVRRLQRRKLTEALLKEVGNKTDCQGRRGDGNPTPTAKAASSDSPPFLSTQDATSLLPQVQPFSSGAARDPPAVPGASSSSPKAERTALASRLFAVVFPERKKEGSPRSAR